MGKLWNSFKIAFAMYSKIPMPKADWEKDNMRYMMCFFPLIGVVIGIASILFSQAAQWLEAGTLLRAAGYVLIPVLITGGIHLDGLLDTADALSSYQTRERKLEILKDSHAGAFAIIMGCAYFILALGIWSEIEEKMLPILGVGYVLSRALSGMALATFPCANQKGSLGMFADAAQKRVLKITLVLWIAACAGAVFRWDWRYALILFGAAAVVYGYYYHVAMKEFGGTTGDIAGFFVQVCELFMAAALMLGGKLL